MVTISPASQQATPANPPTPFEIRAREKAVEFEGVFLSMMVKEMFSGIETEGDFTGGFGEEMFRGMMADEYAQAMAANGGIGLSDQIYREILAQQEI
ncbi:MAG: rod-binding protein [Rhizobiales bacterium]|nr:rod-binding protein [Hyphomicrobiales bacterium]